MRNNNNVLTSGVADLFVADYTRYHCPIIAVLKFTRPYTPSFRRNIWNYRLADYDKYRTISSESDLLQKIEVDENMVHNIQVLSGTIIKAAEESIPNKIVTIKPDDLPWITCHIKNLIRRRKRTNRQFKKTNNMHFRTKYKQLRNKTNKAVRNSKNNCINKLVKLLSFEKTYSKLF